MEPIPGSCRRPKGDGMHRLSIQCHITTIMGLIDATAVAGEVVNSHQMCGMPLNCDLPRTRADTRVRSKHGISTSASFLSAKHACCLCFACRLEVHAGIVISVDSWLPDVRNGMACIPLPTPEPRMIPLPTPEGIG